MDIIKNNPEVREKERKRERERERERVNRVGRA
jgi:hypothetical protein